MSNQQTQIRHGSIINLQSTDASGTYLDTRGRVKDKSQFNGSPELVFVSTYPSVNRHRGSGSWKIISADDKHSGAPLCYGDRIHLLNLYPGVGYLDLCSLTKDFSPFKGYPDAGIAFTHGSPNRDNGSGTWTIESADNKASGTEVQEGDNLTLRNGLNGFGYLYAHGDVETNPAFTEYNGTKSFVLIDRNSNSNKEDPSRAWKISVSDTHTSFELDEKMMADMIPMTDKSSGFQYSIKLEGSAISAEGGVTMHFDTGSWDVCIPEHLVGSKCTPVTPDTSGYKPWGLEAVRMKGDFVVKSAGIKQKDGTLKDVKEYVLKDFIFFKILNNDANKKANSNVGYMTGIVGGFPSKSPGLQLPSISYALAKSQAMDDSAPFGFGIVSKPPKAADGSIPGITEGWDKFESYLSLCAGPDLLKYVTWRSDIPLWQTDIKFCPEAVPGFSAEITIPGSDQKLVSAQYIATIDTGAPDFTARFKEGDPYLNEPFKEHFTKTGAPAWWKVVAAYDKDAQYLINAKAKILFKDDNGIETFYSFSVGDKFQSPATFVTAKWDSTVPWPVHDPEKPVHRANLGNTIYYYANIMYYDFKNKRVGFCFI